MNSSLRCTGCWRYDGSHRPEWSQWNARYAPTHVDYRLRLCTVCQKAM